MTTTETRYPSKIDQLIGENYQPFNGLKNIKTAKGYAESASPITSKKGNKNRPSTLWLYNYKFNIPSDAEVTKVTISYKWGKIGACTENKQKKPCKTTPSAGRCWMNAVCCWKTPALSGSRHSTC